VSVTTERIVGEHTIHGVPVQVQSTTWRGEDGTSYDLIAGGEVITEESWDEYPTEQQMAAALRKQASEFCRFCTLGIIGASGHLIGNAEPGSNPWCCDDCWDERLR
jgi:hypothetical protein